MARPWRGILGRLAADLENPYTPPAKGLHLRRIWLDDRTFDKRLRAVEIFWNGKRIGTYIRACDKGTVRDALKQAIEKNKREALTEFYKYADREELVRIAVESAMNAT